MALKLTSALGRLLGAIALLIALLALPGIARAGISYNGDWQTGDNSQWSGLECPNPSTQFSIGSAPGGRPGYAARFQETPADVWPGNGTIRCLDQRGDTAETAGNDYWFGLSAYFPGPTMGDNLVWELHHPASLYNLAGCGVAPYAILIDQGKLVFRFAGANCIVGQGWTQWEPSIPIPGLNPTPVATWVDFAIHIRFTEGTTGVVELYARTGSNPWPTSPLITRSGIPTLPFCNSCGIHNVLLYTEVGLYKGSSTMSGTDVAYLQGYKRGSSFADVAFQGSSGPVAVAPASTAAPAVGGTATVGQTLTTSVGTWSGTTPIATAIQWQRCSSTGGSCAPIAGATAASYALVAADQGMTLRSQVTASNAAGTATAASAVTSPVAAASSGGTGGTGSGAFFDTVVTDPGCTRCTAVEGPTAAVVATIGGGADSVDTAFLSKDFGGPAGVTGTVWTRDLIGLPSGVWPAANLAVTQVDDTAGRLVYELYVQYTDRALCLWSPPGGLASGAINQCTGVLVPNDGSSTLRAEVAARVNGSLTVRVNGTDRVSLTGLSGAATSGQRFLAAGIDHYDTAATDDGLSVKHASVGYSLSTWLGDPAVPVLVAPAVVTAPALAGTAAVGATLTASTGTWSSSPTAYAYGWLRCDASGGNCAAIAGAASSSYVVASADVGLTLRAAVTATNAAGSTTAVSAASAAVPVPVPAPYTSLSVSTGCSCSATASGTELKAQITGATGAQALGIRTFATALAGRTYSRDVLRLPAGQAVSANLAVFQVLDGSGRLVYELYVAAADRTVRVWSPAGGLTSGSINASTGIAVPSDGTAVKVEVSALRNSSLVVRVNGTQLVSLSGFSGASTSDAVRYEAGIDHYDATASTALVAYHSSTGLTTAGWLG